MLVGDWIWIQLCRLGSVGISAGQTTARFDVGFFFFFFALPPHLLLSLLLLTPPPNPLPPRTPQLASPPPPLEVSTTVRSGPAVMDWHPVSVKTALWLFNEAISQGGASADTGHSGFLNRKSKKKPNRSGFILGCCCWRGRTAASTKEKEKSNQLIFHWEGAVFVSQLE